MNISRLIQPGPGTLLFVLVLLLINSCSEPKQNKLEIRGIYGHPKPFWKNDIRLDELGVNSIFLHSGSIDSVLMSKAKEQNLKVFAEFATLNGKNYVEHHPEAWPINEHGEKVSPASWFMGICPTDTAFKSFRFNQLRTLLQKYDLDGVWMDYLHWHAQFEEPEPILPETCFCDRCTGIFAASAGITLEDTAINDRASWILNNQNEAWRLWRCRVIYDWTMEIKAIVKEVRPDALLGLYHCPWNDDEYNGARQRILGLDYDLLRPVIDVFSPMVYHGRMGRKPEWVAENIEWFCKRLNIESGHWPKVWPIVQAYDEPDYTTPDEFIKVLSWGSAPPVSGVMMFTTRAVAADAEKTRAMKYFYLESK
jgi:hypothetical protein